MSGPQDVNRESLFVELSDGTRWYPGRDDNIISADVIAYSLSSLTRFTGHAKRLNGNIYTVAEHSIKVSYLVPTLTGLFHDAHECIVNDLSKPNKVFLGGSYGELETACEKRFAKLFGLDYPRGPEIKHADILMVLIESFDLLQSKGRDWGYYQEYRAEATDLYINRPELRANCWPPDVAYDKFIDRYLELAGGFE